MASGGAHQKISVVVRAVSKTGYVTWKAQELDAFWHNGRWLVNVSHVRLRSASITKLRVAAVQINNERKS